MRVRRWIHLFCPLFPGSTHPYPFMVDSTLFYCTDMVVHEENRPRYSCTHPECDRSFLNEEALAKHLQKPHERVRKLSNGRYMYKDYRVGIAGRPMNLF